MRLASQPKDKTHRSTLDLAAGVTIARENRAFRACAKASPVDLAERHVRLMRTARFGRRWHVSFASEEGHYKWFHVSMADSARHMGLTRSFKGGGSL